MQPSDQMQVHDDWVMKGLFMNSRCSGVILAGGQNRRFSGQNKAFLDIVGTNTLDRIYHLFTDLFEEIILVTKDPRQYLHYDMLIVTDFFDVPSSLTGIHAGLFYSSNPYAFFTACDTPFLKKELVQTVLDCIDPGFDAVIPETSKGMEPLCAAYSKNSLNTIEQHLVQNKLKIIRIFKKRRVKMISEKVLRQADPKLLSFFNINTPEDLIRAEHLAKAGV
jgi:molybdopterin-guanine dinucleotide biosynthesis protein A